MGSTGLNLSSLARKVQTYQHVPGISSQAHAKFLDRAFGFKISKVEIKLEQKYRSFYHAQDPSNRKAHYSGTQTWVGLHPQVLLTPYNDIYEALNLLKTAGIEPSKIIDIGCAYGRVAFVSNAVFPEARFIGYEVVRQRVSEANRVLNKLGLINAEVIMANVLEEDFELPSAQVYFIYDFSDIEDIDFILRKLRERPMADKLFLIARGSRVGSLLRTSQKLYWKCYCEVENSDLAIFKTA